jgi:uncharacterized membrane protein
MNPLKPWYLSKSIWGGIVAVAASLAGLFGITMGADDQAAITDAILQATGAAAAAFAIFGRIAARTRIR